MQYTYNPSSDFEKFGMRVYDVLTSENEPVFFVGGMVRDSLLNLPITDIDIATTILPDQVFKLLTHHYIAASEKHKKFGIIIASKQDYSVEIATLRQDTYAGSRYPKVAYASTPETDSARRDLTINALYLDKKSGEILDYHNGISDLENKIIKFIGNPEERIQEDPLRIVRAYRFKLTLGFNFDKETEIALQKSFPLLKNISANRISTELNKISDQKIKIELEKVIHNNA